VVAAGALPPCARQVPPGSVLGVLFGAALTTSGVDLAARGAFVASRPTLSVLRRLAFHRRQPRQPVRGNGNWR
jgi:hypothetical protein